MMGLIIEEMQEDVGKHLFLRLPGCRVIRMPPAERRGIIAAHHGDDPLILRCARLGQLPQIIVNDRIEPIGVISLPRKALQP